MQPVFDGHNDVLLRLWRNARAGSDPVEEFTDGTDKGHIDLPRARAGGLAGGLCAIYIPAGELVLKEPDAGGRYATPLSPPLERTPSLDVALQMATIALRLDRAGAWKLCRTGGEISDAMTEGSFAAVLHMEGCEAIGADLTELEVFYAAGLRSLGPVWSSQQYFRPRSALFLSDGTGYRPRTDERGPRPGEGVQPPRYFDRPVTHHREGFLGRRQTK